MQITEITPVKQKSDKPIRLAAYCRVSSDSEDQLHSFAAQIRYYSEFERKPPEYTLVDIYADEGLTGTDMKKRDELNRLIRDCQKGKIDRIIIKSISRFARNTVDCLTHTRMLKDLGVDVYFEEQGIHSTDHGAEFYITIYGCIAQSESENISANVKWGKAKSADAGKVSFHYKNFLGYRRGADGKLEIDPEQAAIIRLIYEKFLAGDSYSTLLNVSWKTAF